MAFDLTKAFQGAANIGTQGAYIGNQLRARYGKKAAGIGSGIGAAAGFLLGGKAGGPDPNLGANAYRGTYDAIRADVMRRARGAGRQTKAQINQALSARGINQSQAAVGVHAANQGRILSQANAQLTPIYADMENRAVQDRLMAKRIGEHERRQGYMDTLLATGMTAVNWARETKAEQEKLKLKAEQDAKNKLPSQFLDWDAKTQSSFLQGKGIPVPQGWETMTAQQRNVYLQGAGLSAIGPVAPPPTPPPPQGRQPGDIKEYLKGIGGAYTAPDTNTGRTPADIDAYMKGIAGAYGGGTNPPHDPLPEPTGLSPEQVAGAPVGDQVAAPYREAAITPPQAQNQVSDQVAGINPKALPQAWNKSMMQNLPFLITPEMQKKYQRPDGSFDMNAYHKDNIKTLPFEITPELKEKYLKPDGTFDWNSYWKDNIRNLPMTPGSSGATDVWNYIKSHTNFEPDPMPPGASNPSWANQYSPGDVSAIDKNVPGTEGDISHPRQQPAREIAPPREGPANITPAPTSEGQPQPIAQQFSQADAQPVAPVNPRTETLENPPQAQQASQPQNVFKDRLKHITSVGEGGFTGTPIKDPVAGWNIGIGRSLTKNGMDMQTEVIPFMKANGMKEIEIQEKLRELGLKDAQGKVRLTKEQFNGLFPKGITESQSDLLFKNDYNMFVDAVGRSIGKDVYSNLTPARQLALLDMIYTMGEGSFNTFKDMISAIKSGNYEQAAKEMKDSNWYTGTNQPGPRRVDPLIEMMRTGRMPGEATPAPAQQASSTATPTASSTAAQAPAQAPAQAQDFSMRGQLTQDEQKYYEEQSKTPTTRAELATWGRNNPAAMRAIFQNPNSELAQLMMSEHTGHILASVFAQMGDEAAAEALRIYNMV